VGNKCYFFVGAAVFGDVSIGNNCVLGAHSVLTTDLADGGLAVGVPAKIYPERGAEMISSWKV
jgi:serine O-acetyltransferase